MQGFRDGFVKLFARRGTGIVLGGVVVAPRASELILPVSLAVEQSLTVDQMAHTFAVYPSLSGSLTEAARKLMRPAGDTPLTPQPGAQWVGWPRSGSLGTGRSCCRSRAARIRRRTASR